VSIASNLDAAKPAEKVEHSTENLLLRSSIAQFLAEEAELLDNWHLKEWFDLFTPDAQYLIPAMDCTDPDPKRDMFFIDDDYDHLKGRVNRLLSRRQHREYPSSRTRRILGQVCLTAVTKDSVSVKVPFAVYRARDGVMAPYVGVYRYGLVRQPQGGYRIRYRRADLDHERLTDHGAISIIL
jgi:p-cumate 2,3-dioxygenase beta subunit